MGVDMGSSVFPVASTVSTSSTGKNYVTATSANTVYSASGSFSAGTYTVTTSNAAVVAHLSFTSASGMVGTGVTVSGTASVTVSSEATGVQYLITSSSSIIINFEKTGTNLTYGAASGGVLSTLTSSGTFTGTGIGYVVVVGGGGGGGYSSSHTGGSGGISSGIVNLTGSLAYTVGTGGGSGIWAHYGGSPGGSGGTTTFGTVSATGGGGSTTGWSGGSANGAGGSPGGVAGGASAASPASWVVSGATGYGNGAAPTSAGGDGVIYVLRFS